MALAAAVTKHVHAMVDAGTLPLVHALSGVRLAARVVAHTVREAAVPLRRPSGDPSDSERGSHTPTAWLQWLAVLLQHVDPAASSEPGKLTAPSADLAARAAALCWKSAKQLDVHRVTVRLRRATAAGSPDAAVFLGVAVDLSGADLLAFQAAGADAGHIAIVHGDVVAETAHVAGTAPTAVVASVAGLTRAVARTSQWAVSTAAALHAAGVTLLAATGAVHPALRDALVNRSIASFASVPADGAAALSRLVCADGVPTTLDVAAGALGAKVVVEVVQPPCLPIGIASEDASTVVEGAGIGTPSATAFVRLAQTAAGHAQSRGARAGAGAGAGAGTGAGGGRFVQCGIRRGTVEPGASTAGHNKPVCVVVTASSVPACDLLQLQFWKCLHRMRCAMETGTVLPGAGAVWLRCAAALRLKAEQLSAQPPPVSAASVHRPRVLSAVADGMESLVFAAAFNLGASYEAAIAAVAKWTSDSTPPIKLPSSALEVVWPVDRDCGVAASVQVGTFWGVMCACALGAACRHDVRGGLLVSWSGQYWAAAGGEAGRLTVADCASAMPAAAHVAFRIAETVLRIDGTVTVVPEDATK